jgi:hypothetical protein
LAQTTPLDDTEVAETPVPLPLVALLTIIAVASLATFFRNPLNRFAPYGRPLSAIGSTRKAVSLQRIETVGRAIEKYNVINGRLPERLQDLAPYYVSAQILTDPWGNAYKYLQQPDRYLVIGFAPDGKVDTDLMLTRAIDIGPSAPPPPKNGQKVIELVPD